MGMRMAVCVCTIGQRFLCNLRHVTTPLTVQFQRRGRPIQAAASATGAAAAVVGLLRLLQSRRASSWPYTTHLHQFALLVFGWKGASNVIHGEIAGCAGAGRVGAFVAAAAEHVVALAWRLGLVAWRLGRKQIHAVVYPFDHSIFAGARRRLGTTDGESKEGVATSQHERNKWSRSTREAIWSYRRGQY